MTDRGIPSAEGAVACPFVAFDDDRDARSTAPDHRHRCFAEPVPAPRAIAHQDAYCLSPAFAVCPAFQDWARREAAAARPASSASAPAPRAREDDTSGPVPMPPADREPRHAPYSTAQPLPPRRAPSRDWAAPPPWVADAAAPGDDLPANAARGAIPGWGGDADEADRADPRGAPEPRARARDDWGDASRGLADSPAARVAGPDPDMRAAARPTSSWAPAATPREDPGEVLDDDDEPRPAVPPRRAQSTPVRPVPPRSSAGALSSNRPVPAPRTPSPRDGARPGPTDASELFGPAWERPRRYEAYPTLKTRVGLPAFAGIPRLAIAAIALVIAAAFLFFVSPMILGLPNNGAPAADAAPSGGFSAAPTDTPVPTATPAPTPTVYTVKSGDTLSAIAQRFNTTLKALLAANPQIKNPNAIKIGDPITIPVPASVSSGAVGGASPSAVAGESATP